MSSDRETTLRDAVIAFLAKWPDAKKAIDSVCLIAHVHGAGYSGPTLGVEIEAMQAALASTPPASDDEQTIRDIAKSLDVSPQELTAYALESVGAPASVPVEPSGCVWKPFGSGMKRQPTCQPGLIQIPGATWRFCPHCGQPLSLVSEDA